MPDGPCYRWNELNIPMSYDLMVFDPQSCPPDREGFLKWYAEQTQWSEGHSYDNDDVTTPALRAWYSGIRLTFPAMNGPYAVDDPDNPKITDYSVGRSIIYASFAWPEADNARDEVFRLAEKHRIGFFDVSADNGGVWSPTASAGYSCIHSEQG